MRVAKFILIVLGWNCLAQSLNDSPACITHFEVGGDYTLRVTGPYAGNQTSEYLTINAKAGADSDAVFERIRTLHKMIGQTCQQLRPSRKELSNFLAPACNPELRLNDIPANIWAGDLGCRAAVEKDHRTGLYRIHIEQKTPAPYGFTVTVSPQSPPPLRFFQADALANAVNYGCDMSEEHRLLYCVALEGFSD